MKSPAGALPRFQVLTLAAALTFCTPALAATGPDDRIRDIAYAPNAVYRVTGAFRTATQIIFSPDETVRHAAIGDSVAWEIAAEGSVVFLKPRERHQPTNLLVVTDRGGVARHYAFELIVRAPGAAEADYQIRFLYPQDEQARLAAAVTARAVEAETQLTDLELQRGAIEGPRNLAWSAQGAPALQPSEVSDNGRFTLLRFPGAQPLPAIFEITADGGERLVPYDVRGEFVIIHGLVRGLRLRRDRSVLCLFNDAFDARGRATGSGTASPVVDRLPTGASS